ncbi:RNA polymerase sigma factor [Mucilaginibacter celer]|uniref:Sigma-70 family RNA polymerase sigma factor n=1 Tax=Mucilaginibacter celer TaxID=2305508 RepID=A0A494VTT4_9SPHI|nr:sigma-70 family RNA polymerase sigma factor [Mucilaginibacter celer]AYL94352.1 sigma-70 family RNA polymerase sigma factor [Mucilaginibacter celer]
MRDYYNYSDHELISLLNLEDQRAFATIYDRYWSMLVNYVYGLTRSEDDAVDIVQELFVSVWNRRLSFSLDGALSAYLVKSARYSSLRTLTRDANRTAFIERLSRRIEQFHVDPEHIDVRRLAECIDKAVSSLPAKMQRIYLMSRDEQLSHKEIARALGIAETTVKKQINNALKIIALKLNTRLTIMILAALIKKVFLFH